MRVSENGNGNGYDADIFVSVSLVLPPSGGMEPEEGYALYELLWFSLLFAFSLSYVLWPE